MSLSTIQDYVKRYGQVAIFGDQITGSRYDDISVQFQYNIATDDIKSGGVVTGSGVVEHNGVNMMRVRAGTGGVAGTAIAESVDVVRYRTGHDIYALFTNYWSAPSAGCSDYIGLLDANDGTALGFNGTSFGCLYRTGGVSTHIPDTSFSETSMRDASDDGIGFVLNPYTINLYRINLGYLGIAPIIWEVFTGMKNVGWLPFHIMEFTNKQQTTHFTNPLLPMRVEVSSNGSAIVDIHTPSWNAGVIINQIDAKADRRKLVRNNKTVSTETSVFTMKNVDTFFTKTNRVVSELSYISASAEGTKPVTVYLKKNATLGGSPSYANIDATNSVIQRDVAGTTVTGGTTVFALELGKSDARIFDLSNEHIKLLPGETLTASGASAASSDVTITIGERELF